MIDQHYLIVAEMRCVLTDNMSPGSILERASECQHLSWFSPQAQEVQVANPGVRSLCLPCFVKNPPPNKELAELPGERAVMAERGVTDEEYDRYRDWSHRIIERLIRKASQ